MSGAATIKNIIGYKDFKNDYCFNTAGAAVFVAAPCGIQKSNQFSNELQLSYKSGGLNFIGGLFYFRESGNDANDQTQLAILSGLIPANSPPPANRQYQDFDAVNTSYSAFAHAEYDLSSVISGVSVGGGLRWTFDKRAVEWHNRNEIRLAPNTNNRAFQCRLSDQINGLLTNASVDRNLCFYGNSAKFDEPTWDVSIKGKISSRTQIYLSHRHGYRAGGFVTTPTSPLLAQPFLPEKINDIEFGVKSDFDIAGRPARFNIAGYHGWYSNIQRTGTLVIPNPPGPPSVVGVTTTASKGRIYGIETEFEWRPSTWLSLTANHAYTGRRYSRYTDVYLVAGVPTTVDLSDVDFTYTPKHQVNASATLFVPATEGMGDPSVTVSGYYQSSVGTSDFATSNCGPNGLYFLCLQRDSRLAGYVLMAVRADWKNFLGSGVDLAAFVNNALDKKYRTFAANLQNGFGTKSESAGAPRTVGISARFSFGGETR